MWHSLATHFHRVVHVLLDVERTTVLGPDCLEVTTILKDVRADFPKCSGKRNFLGPAARETPFSKILNSVRDLNALQILAVRKRLSLDSLQCGWKRDKLYRCFSKNLAFVLVLTDDLFYAQSLQTFVQIHPSQLLAELKRLRAYLSHACRENELFKPTP